MSSVTPTISSAGIGSGLDVNSIVNSLMAVEQQPLTKLQTAYSALQTKLSTFGQMKSAISALHDAMTPLISADAYKLTTTSSSDPSSVSAGTTPAAQPGNYTVSVTSLAAAQSLFSASGQFPASSSVVGTGTMTVRLGSWSTSGPATFTPKVGSSDILIPIGASENTLAGIRDKINSSNAGITASLITDSSGVRIAMQSSTTGKENGFRIDVADDDGNNYNTLGLSSLNYDPAVSYPGMTLATASADTAATINGIPVTSATTTLTGVIDGVTLNLSKVTTGPVSINIARNTDSIKTKLSAFVSAYNQLNKFLSDSTKYDPATKTAALLQGDGTTIGIQNQLHNLLGAPSGASSVYTTLSSLGVEVQKDGSLLLNDTKTSAALTTNLPELTKALSNVDAGVPANNGFAKKFAVWTDNLLSSTGSLPGKTTSIQSSITANEKDQTRLTDRLALTEKRLRAQYSALDTTMANANALSKYVTQQITTWNKSSN